MDTTEQLPKKWGLNQWRSWKERNPWLVTGEGGLGCIICKEAKTLLLSEKKIGVHLSDAWINGTVSSPVQKQLRKKSTHRDSLAHERAAEIADLKQKEILPSNVVKLSSAMFEETASSFRTAYTVAKERLPFSKFSPIMTVNELNGAKVGPAHRSDHSCANMVEHIAEQMKRKIISNVKALDSRISVTLDESTILCRAYMIIYVRCDVTGKGDLDNLFFDLVELDQGTDAESLYNSLRNSLQVAGMDAAFLRKNVISIATDGAAVLTGKQTGLIGRLKQDFPRLQAVHCLAHRVELAVNDSLKVVAGCNNLEYFLSKHYVIYHQSTKNARELEQAASELNMHILKIGKDFTIRWVASSFKTVKAVLKDFPVLAHHFRLASEDGSRSGVERAKYTGLLKHLSSTGFVEDIATMKDVLRELKGLSLKLQRRDTSRVDASRFIHQTIEVLSAMKDRGGKTEIKVKTAITRGQLKGVVLTEAQPKIKKSQFYQAIVDNLTKRLPESDLVTMLKPMDQHFWPKERAELVFFGEHEVATFAKLLGESATEAVSEFRDWKLEGDQGNTLNRLIVAGNTVLPTSAECERGFSACNDTDCQTRNRLRARSLPALLFVDLNGPPLDRFDPAPFVQSWIKTGHRMSASWVPGPQPQPAEIRPLWSIFSP
ncbi:E3 SUMO-protein ligase KIAA1586-like [Siphateles boraxobius]|uniref:E3 SUMO-protein ligase KIAA1586-like n=1 Tax=Siphateles boraxobius TaxID=180520 RepID=UPI0040647DA2